MSRLFLLLLLLLIFFALTAHTTARALGTPTTTPTPTPTVDHHLHQNIAERRGDMTARQEAYNPNSDDTEEIYGGAVSPQESAIDQAADAEEASGSPRHAKRADDEERRLPREVGDEGQVRGHEAR